MPTERRVLYLTAALALVASLIPWEGPDRWPQLLPATLQATVAVVLSFALLLGLSLLPDAHRKQLLTAYLVSAFLICVHYAYVSFHLAQDLARNAGPAVIPAHFRGFLLFLFFLQVLLILRLVWSEHSPLWEPVDPALEVQKRPLEVWGPWIGALAAVAGSLLSWRAVDLDFPSGVWNLIAVPQTPAVWTAFFLSLLLVVLLARFPEPSRRKGLSAVFGLVLLLAALAYAGQAYTAHDEAHPKAGPIGHLFSLGLGLWLTVTAAVVLLLFSVPLRRGAPPARDPRVPTEATLPRVARYSVPLLVFLAAFLVYHANLDQPAIIDFDEAHYVKTSRFFASGNLIDRAWAEPRPYNFEHPPVGKYLITGSIKLFQTGKLDLNYDQYRLGCIKSTQQPGDDNKKDDPCPSQYYVVCEKAPNGTSSTDGRCPTTYQVLCELGDATCDPTPYVLCGTEAQAGTELRCRGTNWHGCDFDNPECKEEAYSWRLPSALIGSLGVLGMYWIGLRLFNNLAAGLAAAGLLLFDNLYYLHSRLAMLDIYPVAFLLIAFGVALGPNRWHPWAGSVLFGLAISSKFSALFLLPPFVLLMFLTSRRVSRWMKARDALIRGLILPAFVFLASFAPFWWIWIKQGGGFNLDGLQFAWDTFIFVEKGAFTWTYGADVAPHPYVSQPETWLILRRPVFYFVGYNAQGDVGHIYAIGNPAIWWIGAVAVVYTWIMVAWRYAGARPRWGLQALWEWLGRRFTFSRDGAFLYASLLFAAAYGAFFLLQRDPFNFYFLVPAPFLSLMLAGYLGELWNHGGGRRLIALVALAGFAAVFAFYYPVVAGTYVPEQDFQYIMRKLPCFDHWTPNHWDVVPCMSQ